MSGRGLKELLDQSDPMWPIIEVWLTSAGQRAEVLTVERSQAEATLLALNMTTRSPLGAMAYETGGILVDRGWLRLLGASSARIQDGLLAWNGLTRESIPRPLSGAMIVAHDVVGGFFAVNLGALRAGPRTVFYFAPDTLDWMDMEISYSDFLHWAITQDMSVFYADLRWPGWEQEVPAVDGDHGFSFYPVLWATGPALRDRSRRGVPQRELWALHRDTADQLKGLPSGAQVRIQITDDGEESLAEWQARLHRLPRFCAPFGHILHTLTQRQPLLRIAQNLQRLQQPIVEVPRQDRQHWLAITPDDRHFWIGVLRQFGGQLRETLARFGHRQYPCHRRLLSMADDLVGGKPVFINIG
jgi:Protein of unknown function DUF2625